MPTLSLKQIAYLGGAGAVIALALTAWAYRAEAQRAEAKARQASAEAAVWRAATSNWQAASNTNRASYDLVHQALQQQAQAVTLIRSTGSARVALGGQAYNATLPAVERRGALDSEIKPASSGIAGCRTSAATMALRGEL
jgi:hypothetical protein